MSILAQHGYGKSDKIQRGLAESGLSGVILSPRDESPANMQVFISNLRSTNRDATILFDPQFYVSTINPVRDGSLPEYEAYYRSGLTRRSFVSPADIQGYVRATLDYQLTLGVSRLVSPTVLFDDFRDPWSQVALSLAQASIDYHSGLRRPPPLLISLVFSETALASTDSLDEVLDVISLWEVEGFYVVVRRSDSQYRASMEASLMTNLLYLVYSLATLNDYDVVCGYSDLITLPLHAVGVTATGAGWHNGLRQFSLTRFQPASGGRPPRSRYTSQPLLNSILVSELDTIASVDQIRAVLSGTSHDRQFASTRRPLSVDWPLDISTLHHWQVLGNLANGVSTGRISARLDSCVRQMSSALGLYRSLDARGVPFDPTTGEAHLNQWMEAVRTFRAAARV